MLLDDSADHPETTACEWQISDREYAEWQAEIRRVTLPLDVLSCITAIRHGLTSVEMQDSDLRRNVYVSDRRWKNIVKAAQDLRLRPRPHGSLHDRPASRLPLPME